MFLAELEWKRGDGIAPIICRHVYIMEALPAVC